MTELRHGLSSLMRMRGVAALAIAALTIGIAAATTMFSAAYAALLRPVPFPDPDRLVLLFTTQTTAREGLVRSRWSRTLIKSLESSVTSFDPTASFSSALVAIRAGAGDPEQVDGEVVSPHYFDVLGVTPMMGRTFTPADDTSPGASPVVVISERLWRQRYGADPALVGGMLRVNDVPLTVIGILPARFSGLSEKALLWIPRTMAPQLIYDGYLTSPQLFISVVARLKPGVTLERANAELAAASAAFPRPDRTEGNWSAMAQRLGDARVDATLRRSVLLLLAAAGCVLLAACANVAGLLLARGRTRRRELAIRMAIGSGRARIVRQLLVESLLLAAIAGVFGVVLALWGVDVFARYAPAVAVTGRTTMSPFSAPAFDASALLFAIGTTAATSVLCGLAPVLDTWRADLVRALKEGDQRAGARGHMFRGLVVGEVAAATVLLAATALLLGSFVQMQRLRRGFETEGVVTFWVRPPVSRYAVTEGPRTVERLLTSVQRTPGVESAAVNRCTPFTGCSRTVVFFPGGPSDPATAPVVGRHYISRDYFKTLGIPLLAGRVLRDDDRAGRSQVAVINESAARRFWPGENPIGKRVWFAGSTGPFSGPAHGVEIVGVVGDVKYEAVDWPDSVGRPEFYTSYLQFCFPDTMIIVKTRGAPGALVPALRRAVTSVDPALPIYDVLTLDERIGGALSRPRFNTALVTVCAAVAVLLAALGVYGMLSFSVSSRSREIGVRLALGALPGRIVRLIVAEGLRTTLAGVVVGVVTVSALTRWIQGLVLGVTPSDPRMLGTIVFLMLAVAALAAYVPARRASALDPLVVLRQE